MATFLLAMWLMVPLHAAAAPESENGYHKAYAIAEELNPGLSAPAETINLSTPQALLEHMVLSSRQEDYALAAHGLNLRLIPRKDQARKGPVLAEHLCYLLKNKLSLSWDKIPDRPDGQMDVAGAGKEHLAEKPRRNIRIGQIELDGRSLPFRIQRVKEGDAAPVWVFAPSTVENLPLLYERFGPGLLERSLPSWTQTRFIGEIALWHVLYLAGLLLLSLVIGWAVQWVVVRFVKKTDKSWSWNIAEILPGPVWLLTSFLVFYLLKISLLKFTGPVLSILNPILLALVVFAFTWLGTRIIHFLSDYMTRKYGDELENFGSARSRHILTVIDVGRRALIFFALLLGLGIALSQFQLFKVVGLSLLASAGVISVLIGVAAQSMLGNLIGGIQIAVTQPVSIGDSVMFEDEWGYVEKIAYTHIIIRTWDLRRLVVPLRYFLNHPVENWSMKSASLIKPIHFYVDFSADISKIRNKFDELVRSSEEWDETVDPTIEVTGVSERTLEVRGLSSAKNPITAWVMHCRLREEMIRFIREWDDGRYLPKDRIVFDGEAMERLRKNMAERSSKGGEGPKNVSPSSEEDQDKAEQAE
mgnify:CR=1 FL=1